MEQKPSIITSTGEKIYGSNKPPEDIKEILEKQTREEFERAKNLNEAVGRQGEVGPNKVINNVIEMPSKKRRIEGEERVA